MAVKNGLLDWAMTLAQSLGGASDMVTLRDVGISDIDQKHVVRCHPIGGGPLVTLLWRTNKKQGGKPLPQVGATLERSGLVLVVDRIDPPGSLQGLPADEGVLVIKR